MAMTLKTSSPAAENIPKSGGICKGVYIFARKRRRYELYGFLTRDELNVFKLLTNVNGI